MLLNEKNIGDRVMVPTMGIGSIHMGGTIIDKMYEEGVPFYKVAWDDGQYADEWWGDHDLDEYEEPAPTED